jgi:hypothetical protein
MDFLYNPYVPNNAKVRNIRTLTPYQQGVLWVHIRSPRKRGVDPAADMVQVIMTRLQEIIRERMTQ